MLLKGSRTLVVQDMGGFIARVNMPGWLHRWPRDHGYGPLAMVVESVLVPGRVIAMHEHRDDEIVSWVPQGVMRHKDRMGDALAVDAGHLMIMNAGRPIALHRKNALFAGHDVGAENWATIATLIETCKLNAVDPLAYLTATLTTIVGGHKQSQIKGLLPWNYQTV